MFKPNHRHLLVQGYIKDAPKSEGEINSWLIGLVKKVRMQVVAGPMSKYVLDSGNEGLTATICLSSSHASIHIWDAQDPAFFQFDLYSCTEFTEKEVIEYIDESFAIVDYKAIFIDRNNYKFNISV